ncbi:hypothetical protein KA082_02495 [Candidatus Woesebacteria bacterium]|nr:hypothetical protein [Candidatus Woesebacteria bacterium]
MRLSADTLPYTGDTTTPQIFGISSLLRPVASPDVGQGLDIHNSSQATPEPLTEKQLAEKRLNESIKTRYLFSLDHSEVFSPEDTRELAEALEARGYRAIFSPDGKEIIDVAWPNEQLRKADYTAFCQLIDLLLATAGKTIEEMKVSSQYDPEPLQQRNLYAQLIQILYTMPLFNTISRPGIPVTKAHGTTTPGGHTLNVLDCLNTSHLSPEDSFLVLLNTCVHDVGKAFLSQPIDPRQNHAHISWLLASSLLAEYIVEQRAEQPSNYPRHMTEKRKALKETIFSPSVAGDTDWTEETARHYARTLLDPVRLHHLLETVEKGIISTEEALAIIGDSKMFELVTTISIADALSVRGKYALFAFFSLINRSRLAIHMFESEVADEHIECLVTEFLPTITAITRTVFGLPELISGMVLPFFQQSFPQLSLDRATLEAILLGQATKDQQDSLHQQLVSYSK